MLGKHKNSKVPGERVGKKWYTKPVEKTLP